MNEWLLPQYASYSNLAFSVKSAGRVNDDYVKRGQLAVRPVVYLTSAVQITGGDGTSSSPYTLGL